MIQHAQPGSGNHSPVSCDARNWIKARKQRGAFLGWSETSASAAPADAARSVGVRRRRRNIEMYAHRSAAPGKGVIFQKYIIISHSHGDGAALSAICAGALANGARLSHKNPGERVGDRCLSTRHAHGRQGKGVFARACVRGTE